MRVAVLAACALVLAALTAGCGGSRYLRVVVWGSWSDANRALTGAASSIARPVGFCTRRSLARVCVVVDRVTPAGDPGAGARAVVRLARALYWGGVPGGVRWRAASM
jgi:hypothetical protein